MSAGKTIAVVMTAFAFAFGVVACGDSDADFDRP